jgi:hypothetical protein
LRAPRASRIARRSAPPPASGGGAFGGGGATREARERVLAACKKNRIAFLETGMPENIKTKIDQGVRVIAGHSEEAAKIGRAFQNRTMPV